MKVKDLIERLIGCDPEAELLVASDEEHNILFGGWEVARSGKVYIIFGISGTEVL